MYVAGSSVVDSCCGRLERSERRQGGRLAPFPGMRSPKSLAIPGRSNTHLGVLRRSVILGTGPIFAMPERHHASGSSGSRRRPVDTCPTWVHGRTGVGPGIPPSHCLSPSATGRCSLSPGPGQPPGRQLFNQFTGQIHRSTGWHALEKRQSTSIIRARTSGPDDHGFRRHGWPLVTMSRR